MDDNPIIAPPEPLPAQSPAPGPRHRRRYLFAAILVCALLLSIWCAWALTARRVIASSGGLYFFRPVALNVPTFRQGDPRWHAIPLGNTADTLGQTGCAVTSAAMVLKWYGVDTDPGRLNTFLTSHRGYEGSGYIIWEKAAKVGNSGIKKAYEDMPSYWRIDHQLMKGNPVIVRIHFPNGGMHFVVIAGKRGFDYLILDPGAGWRRGLYPLKDITPRIDGLRYYRRTTVRKLA